MRSKSEGVQLGQRAAIYARVSTSDQSCERQVTELTAFAERGGYDVVGIFKETASGASVNRTARNRLLDLAQARQIDAILVSELSRWGRSTQDLLDTLNRLAGWKVSVVAMNGMTFELDTPHGRAARSLADSQANDQNPISLPRRCFRPSKTAGHTAGLLEISVSRKTPSPTSSNETAKRPCDTIITLTEIEPK